MKKLTKEEFIKLGLRYRQEQKARENRLKEEEIIAYLSEQKRKQRARAYV